MLTLRSRSQSSQTHFVTGEIILQCLARRHRTRFGVHERLYLLVLLGDFQFVFGNAQVLFEEENCLLRVFVLLIDSL